MNAHRLAFALLLLAATLAGAAPPPCPRPTPFDYDPGAVSWNRTRTGVFTIRQGPPNHRGRDLVVRAGEPQVLVAKFAYGTVDKDLKGEDVAVFVQMSAPCGPWRALGEARTSMDGQHGERFGVRDDGGRIFFDVPEEDRLDTGRYPIRMVVKGDRSEASMALTVVRPDTSTVVFDIDGTLTTGDSEVLKELNDPKYVPKARPGAVEVVREYGSKGYLIVYVTGRPDVLRRPTERWLRDEGFPPGPVRLTDHLRQALPSSKRVGRYKVEVLRELKQAGLELCAAYGNASTDVRAYAEAGIRKERTFIVGPNAGKQGTRPLEDYRAHLRYVRELPAARVEAPPAPGW